MLSSNKTILAIFLMINLLAPLAASAEGIVREEIIENLNKTSGKVNFQDHGRIVASIMIAPDGSQRIEGAVPDGVVITYYPNQSIMKQCSYINNLRNGKTRYYYENGTVMREIDYRDGKYHGTVRGFDPMGGLTYSEIWENGARNGCRYEYGPEGSIIKVTQWSHGKMQKDVSVCGVQ